MNFLAHSMFAQQDQEVIVGQFCGDFVRGADLGGFSPGIQRGIRLHREIDGYTDKHPVNLQARKLFVPPYRRFASILTDVVYDHYLAKDWSRYNESELEEEDLPGLMPNVDIVIEGSDNFPTRFAVNRACVKYKKPLVSGAAIRFDGQITVFRPDHPDSPCYNCLYKEGSDAAETCAATGVLAPLVGMVGSVQAMEAIKVLTGAGTTLESRLVLFDGLSMEWNEIRLSKNPDCPVCGLGSPG